MKTRSAKFQGLHYAVHEPERPRAFLLYVHGGPGGHSGLFEKAVTEWPSYAQSGLGWVTYDQRGCGRSPDETWEGSHACNLSDLKGLYQHLNETGLELAALVGHSYGVKLVMDLQAEAPVKAVYVGMGFDPYGLRNRSLLMDLLALKSQQRSAYDALYPRLLEPEPPWKLAAEVRAAMPDTELRKFFYWANLAAMDWYFEAKKTLGYEESDAVFRKVRKTVFDDDLAYRVSAPSAVPPDVLWILGFQDFLMGGEAFESLPEGVKMFRGSGHYPQYEEPERFLAEVREYLGIA